MARKYRRDRKIGSDRQKALERERDRLPTAEFRFLPGSPPEISPVKNRTKKHEAERESLIMAIGRE